MNNFFDIENRVHEKFKFHPTLTPRGFKFYEPVLTKGQQKNLNALKVQTLRENEQYLRRHPEVRAIVILLLTNIFKKYSYHGNVIEQLSNYFKRSRIDIEKDIEDYLKTRGEQADFDVDTESTSVEIKSAPCQPFQYSSYSEKSSSTYPLVTSSRIRQYLSYISTKQAESDTSGAGLDSSEGSGKIFDLKRYVGYDEDEYKEPSSYYQFDSYESLREDDSTEFKQDYWVGEYEISSKDKSRSDRGDEENTEEQYDYTHCIC